MFVVCDPCLSVDGGDNPARPAIIAELAEIDALPGAEIQASVGYGYGQAHAEQRTLGVGRHVVGPFEHVVIIRLILPYDMVHDLLHVGTHVGVGILVDAEGAGRVFDEEMKQPRLRQRTWKVRQYLLGDEVASPAFGGERKFFWRNHNFIDSSGR